MRARWMKPGRSRLAMSKLIKFGWLLAAATLVAQDAGLDPARAVRIDLPKDAPLAFVGLDPGDSRTTNRGGATVLDLRATLTFRNATQQRIRGISLLITAQEVTPGGKGSVAAPSLDVAPGATFPVRVNMRLMKPMAVAGAPLVDVAVDGVLFDSLGFYGPDKLGSRRTLTVWEVEARRDRKHFAAILSSGGSEALRQEVVGILARNDARPRLDVQVSRNRVTVMEAAAPVTFAFMRVPDAPVELAEGVAMVSNAEVRSPKVELINRSGKGVKHVDMGWIVRDAEGRDYFAASLPADVNLGPGERATVRKDTALRLMRPASGAAIGIAGMTGFVQSVEYSDGQVWVPTRAALGQPTLRSALGPSPEEQRLLEIYRAKGLDALIAELKRFQ